MPEPQNLLARLADPNQASVFDSTMEQVLRRLAQALQNGELKNAALSANTVTLAGKADMQKLMRALQNTPGARMENEGLVLDLLRRQRPEQGGMPSVRGGVFWLPSLDDPMRAQYTGRGGYGGDMIVRRTAERFDNPIVAEGATGGRVPQIAMDAIKGRGAYEDMRKQVLQKAWLPTWTHDPISPEQLSELLDELGGVPSLADDILQYSRAGNQLPYAIQENVAGNVIRQAGHDAAVGYSPRKMRLSEVFDLRPSAETYPWR